MSLADFQQKIKNICDDMGRKNPPPLIAVTKNRTIDDIAPLLAAGQRHFGENRLQEALNKYPVLKEKYPDLLLHFIGHLQTNKIKEAVSLFDVIESLDREKLATALKKEMDKQQRNLPCFIQVNTGAEAQKHGVLIQDLEALYHHCTENLNLDIRGLMCIPPKDDVPDLHFALLHKLATGLNLPELSMGMSSDFDRALRYGATQIRIGTALFEETSLSK